MRKSISTALLVLSPLLAGAGELPVPWSVVAKTPAAPRIDGQIDEDEWRYASAVSGFVTLGSPDLAPEQTIVYVTYDAANLYIAYKCFSEGGRPNAVKVERDGSVWGGDSVELSISPPWMKPGQYYHFIGNYHGICSLYENGSRMLLVLSNVSNQRLDAKLKLGDMTVRQLKRKRATNALDGTPIELAMDGIAVAVPAEDFRLIVVE